MCFLWLTWRNLSWQLTHSCKVHMHAKTQAGSSLGEYDGQAQWQCQPRHLWDAVFLIYAHTALWQTATSAAHTGRASHIVRDSNIDTVLYINRFGHKLRLLLGILQHTSTVPTGVNQCFLFKGPNDTILEQRPEALNETGTLISL